MIKFDREENIVGKGENAYQSFKSFLSQGR